MVLEGETGRYGVDREVFVAPMVRDVRDSPFSPDSTLKQDRCGVRDSPHNLPNFVPSLSTVTGKKDALFTVTLPVSATRLKEAEQDVNTDMREQPIGLQGLRLLVADDDEDARELLRTILEGYGASVTTVALGEETFTNVMEAKPDLLISDIGMPVLDGYGLIKRIRSHPHPAVQALPAVALTAHARRQNRVQALNAGYDGHIAKPFDPVDLGIALSRVLSDRD